MNWSQLFGGVITSFFGLIAGYWITRLNSSRLSRKEFRIFMHGLIIEFRQIEDAGIKDWYKSTVSNVRQESIRVTDDISRSKRLKFYAAWMRYCSMIKTKNGQEDDSALKPSKLTFEEVTEKILSGKHISYDFKFMRGLVNLQLINIRELAE